MQNLSSSYTVSLSGRFFPGNLRLINLFKGFLFPTFFPKLKGFRLKIGSKTVCYDDGRLCALNFLYLSI